MNRIITRYGQSIGTALGLFFLLSCNFGGDQGENEVHLIPENFTGVVCIRFNQSTGEAESYENENRSYAIDSTGLLNTKFSPNSGFHIPKFFFVKRGGKRVEIPLVTDNPSSDSNQYEIIGLVTGVNSLDQDTPISFMRYIVRGPKSNLKNLYEARDSGICGGL